MMTETMALALDDRTASPYRFRPFTRADLALAARWLRTSEMARWWGDPEAQLALPLPRRGRPRFRSPRARMMLDGALAMLSTSSRAAPMVQR